MLITILFSVCLFFICFSKNTVGVYRRKHVTFSLGLGRRVGSFVLFLVFTTLLLNKTLAGNSLQYMFSFGLIYVHSVWNLFEILKVN